MDSMGELGGWVPSMSTVLCHQSLKCQWMAHQWLARPQAFTSLLFWIPTTTPMEGHNRQNTSLTCFGCCAQVSQMLWSSLIFALIICFGWAQQQRGSETRREGSFGKYQPPMTYMDLHLLFSVSQTLMYWCILSLELHRELHRTGRRTDQSKNGIDVHFWKISQFWSEFGKTVP